MRAGRTEEAAALAVKVGTAIKSHNSVELCKVDILSNPKSLWDKVRQLTGRSQSAVNACHNPAVTATSLNNHYTAISSDADYTASSIKNTVNNELVNSHISDWQMFEILDTLRRTVVGLDGIPAWFLRVGAPFFAAPLAALMNLVIVYISCTHTVENQLPFIPSPKNSPNHTLQVQTNFNHLSSLKNLGTHCRP